MPDSPGLELIMAEINRSHPGAVIDTSFDREQPALVVDPAMAVTVLTWLRETPGQEYTFLSSLHGADYFPREPRFAVHYELMNRERHERLRVKAVIPDPATSERAASTDGEGGNREESGAGVVGGPIGTPGEGRPSGSPTTAAFECTAEIDGEVLPVIPSCVHLFPTAEFQEREVFDFFGIVFDGHPDLRRILMPEDYVGWPQRRDFPVGGEPVLFTKDEVDNPGWWK